MSDDPRLVYTCSEGCGYTAETKGACPYCECALTPTSADDA